MAKHTNKLLTKKAISSDKSPRRALSFLQALQKDTCALMFTALAYLFVTGTVGLVLMLLWLAWEQHRITRAER